MGKILRQYVKYHLKNSRILFWLLKNFLKAYLRLAYLTSRWHFIYATPLQAENFAKEGGRLFVLWHNRLAYGMYIFRNIHAPYALASSHLDGRILSDIIQDMGYKVIFGSSNRRSFQATRQIIKNLQENNNIVITPDGPRGPREVAGGNAGQLAAKFATELIPLTCCADRYFTLRSWDKMQIPKLFSKITVQFGAPLEIKSQDNIESNKIITETLKTLELELKR